MSLCSKWFRGDATPDEKKHLELSIRNSVFTLDLLSKVIEQSIEELNRNKFEDYSTPGWDLRRADKDGQIRALRDILKMTKLEGTTND